MGDVDLTDSTLVAVAEGGVTVEKAVALLARMAATMAVRIRGDLDIMIAN